MNLLRKFLCNIMGWHKCETEDNDGLSNIGHCKYCGVRCLQDSQGNWFDPDKIILPEERIIKEDK